MLQLEHLLDERHEQFPQVALAIEAEAVGHDLAGQAVAAEECLHAVGYLYLQQSLSIDVILRIQLQGLGGVSSRPDPQLLSKHQESVYKETNQEFHCIPESAKEGCSMPCCVSKSPGVSSGIQDKGER